MLSDQACACIYPALAAGLDGWPGSAHRALGPIFFVEVGIICGGFLPDDVAAEPGTRPSCESIFVVAKCFKIIRENSLRQVGIGLAGLLKTQAFITVSIRLGVNYVSFYLWSRPM